jgi:iron complex transport system substrate-binding protein
LHKGKKVRIVSLIASATEIICALGFEEYLVGCSHECDYPPSVARLPVCTRPRFDVSGSSREIDERVKALRRQSLASGALSVYEVFADRLRELKPTHIVTQTQCEVCAVSLKDVERAAAEMIHSGVSIIALQPNSLPDVWEDICRVASGLGATSTGVRLVANLRRRIEKIESLARPLKSRPALAGIEWIDPLMAFGNWTPELVRTAGGSSLFGVAGQHSPSFGFDDLAAKDPDVILIAPCGFTIDQALQDLPVLQSQPGWGQLQAVRDDRVYVADGNQYFNRPGPRLVETLEILAEVLHPEAFHFGHEGNGWVRASGEHP